MSIRIAALVLVSGVFLSACGDTRGQRVVTGAAGGALAGELIDGRPLEGAAVGGVIGAVR